MRVPSRAGGPHGTSSVIPRGVPGLQALLSLQVAVVVIAAMYFGASVLIPVVLAVLLSFLLQPLVSRLRRWGMRRFIAVLLSVLLALALVAGLFWLIGWQLMGLSTRLADNHAIIERKLASLHALFAGSGHLAGLGPVQSELGGILQGAAASPPPPGAGNPPVQPVRVVDAPETPAMLVRQLLQQLAHPVITAVVVFVVTIFVLLQREDLRDRMIRLFGTRDLHRTTLALDDAGERLSRYFLTQLAINSAFGALITLGLFCLGVPSPLLWGILAALLRYVPYVGLLFSATPAVLLAASTFPGWGHAVLAVLLFGVVDQLLGQFAEPMLVGHSTGLSPLSVVLAAAFWGFIWGPVGLILSTPLTVCAVVLGRHVEQLRFLDVLLGDQPPLSPVESLYQRLLAGDLDEIEDQAEAQLRDRSLDAFFDEVVIGALRLAVVDAERAVLDEERLATMADALDELLDTLEEAGSDGVPLPSATGTTILCVPGSFALDRIAVRMMTLSLRRHGIAAAALNEVETGEDSVPTAATLCLCTAARPSATRYAVRRWRRRLPGRALLLGFFRADEAETERARRLVGADALLDGTRATVRWAQGDPQPGTDAR